MNWQPFQTWLNQTSLPLIGCVLFVAMCASGGLGILLHGLHRKATETENAQEGYVVSAVLGLLALLLGFTFSLAVDRFEARRQLVLEEANAIGTAYLRSQMLSEPHRSRMSRLLIRYTDNRIALAEAKPGRAAALLATNDALLTDIWAGTSAAFETVRNIPFSAVYLQSVNALIDLDASRKAARAVRVPPEVFLVLVVYAVVAAGVLGYALTGKRVRLAAAFLLALLTLSLLLILDIDRPVLGGVSESQRPMEELRKSFAAQPPAAFDKWKTPGADQ